MPTTEELLSQAREALRAVAQSTLRPTTFTDGAVLVGVRSALDRLAAIDAHQPRPSVPRGGPADEVDAECQVPPLGWRCTRGEGHEGPCAAVECPEDVALVANGTARLRAAGFFDDATAPAAPAPAATKLQKHAAYLLAQLAGNRPRRNLDIDSTRRLLEVVAAPLPVTGLVDELTRAAWDWGVSCEIDSVAWGEAGDSHNQMLRDRTADAGSRLHAAILAARTQAPAAPAPAAQAPQATPRNEWPIDAIGASGHLAGLAFGNAPAEEIGHCVGLLRDLIEAHAAQAAPAVAAPETLTDERVNATGLDYALGDALSGTKGEWVMQDIADAFKAGVRSAEKHYGITAPTTQEPQR